MKYQTRHNKKYLNSNNDEVKIAAKEQEGRLRTRSQKLCGPHKQINNQQSLFWIVMERILEVVYRHFGKAKGHIFNCQAVLK